MESKFLISIVLGIILLAVVILFVYALSIKSPVAVNIYLYILKLTVGQLTNNCPGSKNQVDCENQKDYSGNQACKWCPGTNPNELQICIPKVQAVCPQAQ